MSRVAILMASLLAVACGTARAQPPDEVRRLRGIIDKDETWSGTILITDHLKIEGGATVRVTPGTIIEFAGGASHRRPTLIVGAEPPLARPDHAGDKDLWPAPGRLEMEGTADRPIVVRTAEKSGPGQLIVTVRSLIQAPRVSADKIPQSAPAVQSADRLLWKHVQFEKLGFTRSGGEFAGDRDVWQPGVQILIRKGGQNVELEHCTFRASAHLHVQSGAGCDLSIHECLFEKAADATSVRLTSLDETAGPRSIRFFDNTVAGMVVLAAGPAEISGNRVIGPAAGIAVRQEAIGDIRIESNYVHCTDESDKGRYVLTVAQPDALVRDNVLIGGAYVVHHGSRRMSGNVLVAAPRLTNDKGGKARTLKVVGALPAGSIFEENVLIGPALSLIGPQRQLRPASADAPKSENDTGTTRVRRNVLDGFDGQTKAVQLGLKRQLGGAVELFDNVVVRCGAMVSDAALEDPVDALLFADYNAIIGGPEKLFQRAVVAGRRAGEEGWSKHDRRFDAAADAGLASPPERMPDITGEVASGSLAIPEARRRFIDAYQSRAGSPLIGAGRPDGPRGAHGDIGLSAKTDK